MNHTTDRAAGAPRYFGGDGGSVAIEARDLAVIAQAFTAASLVVLTAALGLVGALLGIVAARPETADMLALHQVSAEALPYAILFASCAGGLAAFGVASSARTRNAADARISAEPARRNGGIQASVGFA